MLAVTSSATARQRGMTLIEVLVALLIFSFGLLGLIGLQGRAHTFAMSAEDSNRAALLANEIETSLLVIGASSGAIAMPSAAAWSASAASAGLPNASVTFAATTSSKAMQINIYWKSPTAPSASASNVFQTIATIP